MKELFNWNSETEFYSTSVRVGVTRNVAEKSLFCNLYSGFPLPPTLPPRSTQSVRVRREGTGRGYAIAIGEWHSERRINEQDRRPTGLCHPTVLFEQVTSELTRRRRYQVGISYVYDGRGRRPGHAENAKVPRHRPRIHALMRSATLAEEDHAQSRSGHTG